MTVADLWREYIDGIGGRPSVRSLYEAKGHTWVGLDSERKHYARRRIIIKKIKALAKEHAVRVVDVARGSTRSSALRASPSTSSRT